MTIKNKDGSVYKLRSPNPIIKNQNKWDKFTLHNLKPRTDSVPAAPPLPESQPIKENPPATTSFVEDLEATKPQIIVTKPEPTTEPKVDKVVIHCLPVVVKEYRDDIHDESYTTKKNGDPFTFEAIIVGQDELAFRFWAKTPLVTIGSIVYPRTQDKRWWEVIDRQEKYNGWMIDAVPSLETPAFRNLPQS